MIDNFTRKNLTELSEFQKIRNNVYVMVEKYINYFTAILAVLISLKI
jgi:hypothetical protein